MQYSRRRFLRNASLATSGLVASSFISPWYQARASGGAPAARNPLRFPPVFSGGDLVSQITTTNIWPDLTTTVWTYGGSYPGPTIRVRRGELFTARLVNNLPEPTNIHWHGLLVPSDMDGHPSQLVAPGATREFAFTVDQRAGTYWYHPHAHMLTARQAYLGMAGFFIVDDPVHDSLGLPTGEFDVPLAIQDREFIDTRQLEYDPTPDQLMTGLLGNVMLVNGVAEAYHEVSRDLYRFRLLNGANGRVMKIGFDSSAPFQLIGSDAGLLDKPYRVTSLMLGPGERAEILVDFSTLQVGSSATLWTLPYDNAPDFRWQGWGMDIVRFDVTRDSRANASIPQQLIPIEPLVPAAGSRTRYFQLAMVHQIPAMRHVINGREYDLERIDERVSSGAVEHWDFFNSSDEPHPMHLHGAQFQITQRDGAPSDDPKDKGWKDVVLVQAQQTVRVVVQFAEHEGLFVAHCHNLEHEDTGMMINFLIEPPAGVDDDNDDASELEAVWPNPAVDVIRVAFTVRTPTEASLRIIDMRGAVVATHALGPIGAGRYVERIPLGRLASGRYLIQLDKGSEQPQLKFTKT
jgi:FtsP/CotA-like multicopper oxidase with cupredoxin domain